jgi:hypothetical protein
VARAPTLKQRVHALHARMTDHAALAGRPAPVLAPGASKSDLAHVEDKLGPMPAPIRALLGITDGWTNLFLHDETRPVAIFSCAELTAPSHAKRVADARSTRGFARDVTMQKGFIFGGGDNAVLVLSPDVEPAVVHHVLRPRAMGTSAPLPAWIDTWSGVFEQRIARTRGDVTPPTRDPLEIVDKAIEAFNYPGEMGEPVHDSVETLRDLIGALPVGSSFAPLLRRLLAELERGYAGAMQFSTARRRDRTIEVRGLRGWAPLRT